MSPEPRTGEGVCFDYALHERWDQDCLTDLLVAVIQMGVPSEDLIDTWASLDAAFLCEQTRGGQELFWSWSSNHWSAGDDETLIDTLRELEEALLQVQLDAIDDVDELLIVLDQIPVERIPAQTRRRMLGHDRDGETNES